MPEACLNLYLVKRAGTVGWDEYAAFVVAAETDDDARHTFPDGKPWPRSDEFSRLDVWANLDQVVASRIGTALPGIAGIVCADFRGDEKFAHHPEAHKAKASRP